MSPIAPVENLLATGPALTTLGPAAPPAASVTASFADILAGGVNQVEKKLADADALVRKFTLDPTVPIHQVTYALEEARLAVELAMQVRGRLLDSYRELMNMQL